MLDKTTYTHEVLFRFDENGFKGAHKCTAEVIKDNGETLLSRDCGASNLEVGSDEFNGIMTQATNDALAEHGKLKTENASLLAEKSQLMSKNNELEALVLSLEEKNSLLQMQIKNMV